MGTFRYCSAVVLSGALKIARTSATTTFHMDCLGT